MGGRALAEYGVARISAKDYARRVDAFRNAAALCPFEFTYHIPGQIIKDDYGDLDVLFTTKQHAQVIDYFCRAFKTLGKKKNGNCTSIEWNLFQVDFIHIAPESLDFAWHYYCHGTTSALIGRMAQYYGFKFGWQGLSWTNRSKNAKTDVLITRDWATALDILGYDYFIDPHLDTTVDEVYSFLISSGLMSKEVYRQTRPDRNYGFQEEFYEYVKTSDIPNKRWSRYYGWVKLFQYDAVKGLEVLADLVKINFTEFVRPVKRQIRKLRHKYSTKGREDVLQQARNSKRRS